MSDSTTPSALLDAPGPGPAADASRPARSPASRRTVPNASTAPVADEAPPTPDVRVLILTPWAVPAARAGTATRANAVVQAKAAVQADAAVQAEAAAPASAEATVPVVLADRPAPVAEADAVALVAPDDPACPAAGADPAAALPPGAPPPDPLSEALSDALSEPRIEEVLALVRACTGGDPVLCPVSDLTDVVDRLTETVDAVLLLGAVDVLADAPVEDLGRSRLSTLALEELAAPDGPDRLVAALLSAQHPPRARVVALIGTRGGLGTSTFLLHLARACTVAGARVALLDADPAGGLGLLIGDDVVPGLRWGDLPAEEAAFRPDRLVPVLPTWLGMPVLTGDGRGGASSPACVGPALEALRAYHDLVLVDLPRGAEVPSGCLVLLVTGLDLRSAVAAEALAARARPAEGGSVALAVRLVGEDVTTDDLEIMARAPVVARIPHDRAVAQRVARGDDPTRGRGSARRAARAVAAELVGLVGTEWPW